MFSTLGALRDLGGWRSTPFDESKWLGVAKSVGPEARLRGLDWIPALLCFTPCDLGMLVILAASQFPPLENGNGDGSYLTGLLCVTEETIHRKQLAEVSIWKCELFAWPVVISLYFLSVFSSEIVKDGHPGYQVQGGGRPHRYKGPHSQGNDYPEDEQVWRSLKELQATFCGNSAKEGSGTRRPCTLHDLREWTVPQWKLEMKTMPYGWRECEMN